LEFIDLMLRGNEDTEIANKIKDVIVKSVHADYSNFLRSPLLLSMFILTFNTYPELPKKKSKFYWNVFDTLATKHDSFTKKAGFQHERKTGLYNEDFEKILQWFCYKSLFQGKFSFDSEYLSKTLDEIKGHLKYDFSINELIQDLTLAISIIIVDGVEYKFPHKSLQEYFCAMLIKEQSEEIKSKIYKEQFLKYINSSTGGYDNFWNLCFEVDKVNFLNFFIIPNLLKFRNSIYDADSLIQMRNFYEFSQLCDHFVIRKNASDMYVSAMTFSNSTSIYNAIINYLEIGDLFDLTFGNVMTSPNSIILKDINNYCIKSKSQLEKSDVVVDARVLNISRNWNDIIIGGLKKMNYDRELVDLISRIDSTLASFNKIIENDVKVTDSLLGL